MTTKELITRLLDLPMDAEVRVKTSNKDSDNRNHIYGNVDVDKSIVMDSSDGQHYISLLFYNYDFEPKDEVSKNRVDEFLKDIDNYEADCKLMASGSDRCMHCNDTMFQAIRDFVKMDLLEDC